MRAIKKHTAKSLYRAKRCRASFVVRYLKNAQQRDFVVGFRVFAVRSGRTANNLFPVVLIGH